MARNTLSSSGSSGNMYAVLIVIFGLVVGYILYTNALVPVGDETATVPVVPPDTENVTRLEGTSFDFGVLEDIIFKELKVFGEIPVLPGVTGKDNPFD